MHQHRDRFGQALSSVRQQLRSGRYVRGERLMITVLARNLRLSATPIREALSRLAGEGLVEDRRGMGFFAWRLDAVDLVELYHLQAAYLSIALANAAPHQSMSRFSVEDARGLDVPPRDGEAPIVRLEAAFERIVADARSAALVRAHRLLADRLAPSRRVEAAVLCSTDCELATLEQAVAVSDRAAVSKIIDDYHRRRIQHSPEIVVAMRAVRANEHP